MINFWKLAYKSVKEQRDQHKVELQQCKSELHHYRAELESYKTNLKQRKEERESMISDFQKKLDLVSMLKEENRKLETQKIAFQRSYKQVYEENEKLEQIREIKDSALKGADIKIKTLEQENEKYRIRAENAMELAERANCEVLRLERENEKLKREQLQSDYVKASVFSEREEYKKQIVKLHEELKSIKLQNEELKRKK